MRVGMLTGGGDCPGLNAVIRAAVRKGIFHFGDEFVGFIEGWRGVVENKTMPLNIETVSGILQLGGTILRTWSGYGPVVQLLCTTDQLLDMTLLGRQVESVELRHHDSYS